METPGKGSDNMNMLRGHSSNEPFNRIDLDRGALKAEMKRCLCCNPAQRQCSTTHVQQCAIVHM